MHGETGEFPHISGGKIAAFDQEPQNLLARRQPTQVPKSRHELLERNNFEPKSLPLVL
jgi:hypothetical protein